VIVRLKSDSAPSRRTVLRTLASSSVVAGLGGCTSLSTPAAFQEASALTERPMLLVATTRKPINGARAKPWYGPERNPSLTVARAILNPPTSGAFSLASVGLSDWSLDRIEPARGRIGSLLAESSNGRDLLIYVHGFNQTFENATLDAARLADGIRFRGETLVFSWPSKAGLLDYAYDRESAMWSRDAFESVLDTAILGGEINRVHLVAHSMGTMLALESLRQLFARRGEAIMERTGAVVFASPDIDIDFFSSSIQRIGPLTGQITIITAANDRALALSRRLAGGVARVGAAEKARLEQLGLRVIDASQQGWGLINHDLFLSNPEVRQVVRRAINGDSPA
jgi:esterase/lipase superfamily enzyme